MDDALIAAALDIEWLREPAAFAAVAEPWDALAAEHPDPFATHRWLDAWWRAFVPEDRGRILVARRDGAFVGGLALVEHGGRRAAMANEHSPLFRPLAADAEARGALLAAALEGAEGGLTLRAVPDSDPAVTSVRVGWTVTAPSAISPIVETSGRFEDWRAASKPRWGAPLERFRRKMGREYELRLTVNQAPADLEEELARGFAVEGSGWKGRAGTAIVSKSETEAFYRAMAAAFHDRGELACSGIELDGRLVAWDLSLLHQGRVFLIKTGFDEEFRRLAPGLVLRLSVIEDCFARGLVAHELLGHVDDWKPKFATTARRHVTLHLHRRSPRGAVGFVRSGARRLAVAAARRAGLRGR
jgi:CelD/BcsL family acetyltransferase involved in cellulose biosynthesis